MVRRFHASDTSDINLWLHKHNMEKVSADALPEKGYIHPDVAVGFMIETDTDYCLLDFFITNPMASSESRHKALSDITVKLIEKAHELGYKKLKCSTKMEDIARRSVSCGFRSKGFYEIFERDI